MVRDTGGIIIEVPYGTIGEMSIYVNDILYDSVFSFKTTKYLDNVWTFEVDIPGTTKGDTDLAIGKIVKIFIGNDLWLRGTIETSKYGTYQITKIAGIGSAAYELRKKNLSQNEENKSFFEGKDSDYILKRVVSENSDGVAPWIVEANNVDIYPSIFVRADNENRLNAIINTAKAINYNWYESWGAFPYNTPTMNMAEHQGNETSTKTFEVSGDDQNSILTEREEDKDALWNDITVAGYGDGVLQLKSRIYHATLNRTYVTIATTKNGTETINVADTTDFPASGNVWIGCEKITYTGKTGTTFTGITRGVAFMDNTNVSNSYIHTKYAPVYDAQYTITTAETDSSIGDGTETNDANYGVHEKTITDNSIIDQDTLDKITFYLIEEHKTPPISIKLTPIEITDVIPTCSLGDVVIINDPDTGSTNFVSRIVGIDLGMDDAVQFIEITCSNKYVNVSNTVQHIEEENRRLTQYMKGSPNIISVQSYENCDNSKPLKMKFRVWDKTIAIQEAILDFVSRPYRAYTDSTQTASSGGGATSGSGTAGSSNFMFQRQTTAITTWMTLTGSPPNPDYGTFVAHKWLMYIFTVAASQTNDFRLKDDTTAYTIYEGTSTSHAWARNGRYAINVLDTTNRVGHNVTYWAGDFLGVGSSSLQQYDIMQFNALGHGIHSHTTPNHTHSITTGYKIQEYGGAAETSIKVYIGLDNAADYNADKVLIGTYSPDDNNINFTDALKTLVGDLSTTKTIRLQFEPQNTLTRIEANADIFIHLGSI